MSESLTTSLFTGVSRLQACAAFLGQRLDLRTFEDAERLAANPLTFGVGRAGVAVLLRYGAVVLFGLDKEQQQGFIDSIQHLVSEPLKQRETDTVDLALTRETLEGVQHGCIQLQQFDLQRLQVVAEALGKSVVLAITKLHWPDPSIASNRWPPVSAAASAWACAARTCCSISATLC